MPRGNASTIQWIRHSFPTPQNPCYHILVAVRVDERTDWKVQDTSVNGSQYYVTPNMEQQEEKPRERAATDRRRLSFFMFDEWMWWRDQEKRQQHELIAKASREEAAISIKR